MASLFEDSPLLIDISSPVPVKRVLPSAPRRPQIGETAADEKQAAQDAKQATCITIFTASGSHIIAGTSKGWINIISTDTCRTVHSTRLCNGLIIYLRLTSSGRHMVANSSDRVIRTIPIPDLSRPDLDMDNLKLEVEHKFQDIVNRLSWNHVAFSSTGEYVTASTYMNHDIYVWERSQGSLVKILEGPKEELGVVEWHPHKPFVAACGLDSGRIYLWSIISPQKWSALAPDFVEVEENVEYIETEEEFDIHPFEEIHKRRLDREDEEIDALTIEAGKSGFEAGQFRMPVFLDVDDSESEEEIVAVGPGEWRRVKTKGDGRDSGTVTDTGQSGDERNGRKAATSGKAATSRRKR